MHYIRSINWIFTYRCNLRCRMCDIWNNPYKSELDFPTIRAIVSSEIVQKSYAHYGPSFAIGISGGEPLLIKNLKEVMIEIDALLPGSIHSISTNGIQKDTLVEVLVSWQKQGKKLPKINISIDGRECTHDTQRGVTGGFRKTVNTIQTVKRLFPQILIEMKLTITKSNYTEISFFTALADKLGVFFSFKPVENMYHYTNQNTENQDTFSPQEIDKIEQQIVDNPYIQKQDFYISPHFFQSIPLYLRSGLGERKSLCGIADDSLTIMPDGKVYSCILMNEVGNLHDDSLDDIWRGERMEWQRKAIKEGECAGCMLMCGSFKSKNVYGK